MVFLTKLPKNLPVQSKIEYSNPGFQLTKKNIGLRENTTQKAKSMEKLSRSQVMYIIWKTAILISTVLKMENIMVKVKL
jgi:hypothetical protein